MFMGPCIILIVEERETKNEQYYDPTQTPE